MTKHRQDKENKRRWNRKSVKLRDARWVRATEGKLWARSVAGANQGCSMKVNGALLLYIC